MHKRIFGRNLSLSLTAKNALLRSLSRGLILEGKLTTTKARIGALKSKMAKLVVYAKDGSLASRKRALSWFANDGSVVAQLFTRVSKLPEGGDYFAYTPLPPRKGDGVETVKMEWREKVVEKAKVAKQAKK